MMEGSGDEWTKVQITLARIDTTLNAFVAEVRQSSTESAQRMTDHEVRLRALEKLNNELQGSRDSMKALITVIGVIAGIVEPMILYVTSKH